jgi:signal peptidase I
VRRALTLLIKGVVLAAFLALAVAWFFTLRPAFLGGPATYVTVTGTSMEPTLSDGDLVVLRERDTYGVGDVVAFRIRAGEPGAGSRVVHRIIGGSDAEGYVTRGDNRTSDDFWRPTDTDILGELWLHGPGVGRYFPVLRTPVVIAALASALAVWLVLDWGGRKRGQPEEEQATPQA